MGEDEREARLKVLAYKPSLTDAERQEFYRLLAESLALVEQRVRQIERGVI